MIRWFAVLSVFALLLAACASGSGDGSSEGATSTNERPTEDPLDPNRGGPDYDPVRAGEPLPNGFRQLLPRDAIRPVYEPTFRTAADTDWQEDALVIGIASGDESKAYPISWLNSREMVIDRINGIPILVTW